MVVDRLLIFITLASVLTSPVLLCADESEESATESADAARLLAEVRGILAHNCYKCHSSDKQKGDLRLDTQEGVFSGGKGGQIIVPGNPDESELLHRVLLPADDDDAMPPEGARLESDDAHLLRKWIASGAPWPEDGAGLFRRAPLALTKPPVPEGAKGRVDNPIDAFVAKYFQESGRNWPRSVADETFIRRAWLDVIGLLPAYRDVSRFKREKDSDKRVVLVRDLLSRRTDYALHWMTFWNDALRNDFAGTGYIDGGRKQITDWLYASLALNKPYDQFVHELISPVEGSAGFINGIKWRGAVNASQIREMQAAQSLAQVFLGLNLKCASCHDSFINDWKLDDAYALANVFAEQPLEVHRCDQATGRMAETRFLFDELGEIDASAGRAERMKQVANMMIAPENGRTARTIVNRLWAKFFGRGLIEPVDEMDLLPWNEPLLDWLAADLVEHQWDIKHTIELMLSSRAYSLVSVSLDDPNTLTSEEFRFDGPVRRRLSAEQFADAVSQLVHPLFEDAYFVPKSAVTVEIPEIPKSLNNAKWVWLDSGKDGEPEPGTVYFHKMIRPSYARTLLKGEAFLTADNAFELTVNGETVGSGEGWDKLHYVDFSEVLTGRDTEVCVKAMNTSDKPNPAGLFGIVRMTYKSHEGKVERLLVPTYKSWRSTLDPDGTPSLSREVALAGGGPWGELTSAIAMDIGYPGDFVRAVSVKNNAFLKALGRPVRDTISTGRNSQATLLQALELTNGSFFDAALEEGAREMTERARNRSAIVIRRVYREFLGRFASDTEIRLFERRLGKETTPEAVQDFLWGILVSPEFQIIY